MKRNRSRLLAMPSRPRDGHKGTFGRVLILGGSVGMIGAPVFAGTASLRMGTGLAQIAVPNSILNAALSITPELIGLPLVRGRALNSAIHLADSIVVGPGFGQTAKSKSFTKRVLSHQKNIVVDADGLNVFRRIAKWPTTFKANVVLTPHPGEMAKILGREKISPDLSEREDVACQFAEQMNGQIVVLKGHRTIVTDGVRVYVNETGDTSLAKAGTGDILSGMIASLLAQQMPRYEAACLAVHLHGLAGETAGEKLGSHSVLASDVLAEIPRAIRKYSQRVL